MTGFLLNLVSIHALFLISGSLLLYFTLRKRKIKKIFSVAYGLTFLVVSTHFIPALLLAKYEAKQPLLLPKNKEETVFIHVFGAGYNLDEALEPTTQLTSATLARLVEGVRLMKEYPNAQLVTSGRSDYGFKSQAKVVRDAAVALGVDETRIIALSSPHNTYTEIEAFTKNIGDSVNVIAVSDAVHLPRIQLLYSQYPEINAYYVPVNYRVKLGKNSYNGIKFPSLHSIDLLNDYCIAQLKYVKDYLRITLSAN